MRINPDDDGRTREDRERERTDGGRRLRAAWPDELAAPTAPVRPTATRPGAPRFVPSYSPARSHGLIDRPGSAGGGAVSRMNCSIAAAIAAASSGEADWRTSMRGLAGLCFPLRPMWRIA